MVAWETVIVVERLRTRIMDIRDEELTRLTIVSVSLTNARAESNECL